MTSSIPAALAWPLIGALLLVVAARWRWCNSTAAERFLNATLSIIALTQLLRERVVEEAIVAVSPLSMTTVQQLSLCTIVISIAPFLCVIGLLSGRDPKIVRRQQFSYYLVAGLLAATILAAGTRARRAELPLEVTGGWDGVLAWAAFAVLPLFLAYQMVRRCYAEFRQPEVTSSEKLVLTGIAIAGATIGVTTAIALVLAVLQELDLLDSVAYRLGAHPSNFFWIATTIGAVAAAPLVKSVTAQLGYDATSRRWRRLQPLWHTMIDLFPESRLLLDEESPARRITRLQLHRTAVEIRDAMLQLRPYCREVGSGEFAKFVASERIPDRKWDSARLALQLAGAAHEITGDAPAAEARMLAPAASASLDDEVAQLLQLAEWWPAAARFTAEQEETVRE